MGGSSHPLAAVLPKTLVVALRHAGVGALAYVTLSRNGGKPGENSILEKKSFGVMSAKARKT